MRLVYLSLAIVLVLSFIVPSAHANIFWYGDELDRQRAVQYAEKYPYDGIEPDRFSNPEDYSCFDLGAYNRFASAGRYDGYDSLTSNNIKKKDLKRLGRDDYNKVANENPHDSILPDDVDSYGDTSCWTLGDYNRFAVTRPYDKFRPVYFQDWDDLETVQKIGTGRSHFFVPEDFLFFDLQRTAPRRFSLAAHDFFHPQNYDYFGSH